MGATTATLMNGDHATGLAVGAGAGLVIALPAGERTYGRMTE